MTWVLKLNYIYWRWLSPLALVGTYSWLESIIFCTPQCFQWKLFTHKNRYWMNQCVLISHWSNFFNQKPSVARRSSLVKWFSHFHFNSNQRPSVARSSLVSPCTPIRWMSAFCFLFIKFYGNKCPQHSTEHFFSVNWIEH